MTDGPTDRRDVRACRPAGRDLPLDAHLHTDQSPDSDVPIDDYGAAGGRARRIAELAITDHVDFDPRGPNLRAGRTPSASGSSGTRPSAGPRSASRSASGSR